MPQDVVFVNKYVDTQASILGHTYLENGCSFVGSVNLSFI
jgi:hypothetical protein